MPFCTACGHEIDSSMKFCPHCGAVIAEQYDKPTQEVEPQEETNSIFTNEPVKVEDSKYDIFAILGFAFSFVGGVVGLIFSILGLKSEKNRLLSIFGIVISSVVILLLIIFIGVTLGIAL